METKIKGLVKYKPEKFGNSLCYTCFRVSRQVRQT